MDIADYAAPKSDQINADDLVAGPRTVTIAEVRPGSAEQPVEIVTAEYGAGRVYRPGKSMIRVLINAWGAESNTYVGRRMTIYRDPNITFGRDQVGGIRISHLSDIDKKLTLALTVTRGKRAAYVVQPLPAETPVVVVNADLLLEGMAATENEDDLKQLWQDNKDDLGDRRSEVLAFVTARLTQLREPEQTTIEGAVDPTKEEAAS